MTASAPSFTEALRQELSRRPPGDEGQVRAELAAIVRVAGSLTLGSGGVGEPPRRVLEVATTSGAVARRTFTLFQVRFGVRPELLVRSPSGVRRRTTYGVRLAGAEAVARDLGVLDPGGGPAIGELPAMGEDEQVAFCRGALLAAGSVSAPGRPAHLEIVVRSPAVAASLAAWVAAIADGRVTVTDEDPPRVISKSGATIGRLLAAVGADDATAVWEDRRTRRRLRNDANRLANADAANLRRTIEAASAQVAAVERVVEELGWSALEDDLRAVALARLANPAASLSELGELVDPPIGKSAVHRRLRRLEALDPAAGDGG
jgi:cell division protein WhiA